MDRVAAKIAKEVLVLFQYGDLHALAGQQIAQHNSGGSAAYDTTSGF